jgi:hypothetical protein
MDRKKELKEQYKQMKPDMGIFIISSNLGKKCYLEGTQNLQATMNSMKFKLKAGCHPNRELQKEWNELGEGVFTFRILEKLEYEKDEMKTDYKEDLALLKIIWEEKILKENIQPYKS